MISSLFKPTNNIPRLYNEPDPVADGGEHQHPGHRHHHHRRGLAQPASQVKYSNIILSLVCRRLDR